jgi:hypothetical protein
MARNPRNRLKRFVWWRIAPLPPWPRLRCRGIRPYPLATFDPPGSAMTYLVLSAILLIVGNLIAETGDRRSAAVPYRSPEYLRGSRLVSIGTAINMVGGVLLVVGVISFFI